MLEARCPLYTYKQKMFPYEEGRKKHREVTHFRNQLKVRDEMFCQLRKLKKLRVNGELTKVVNYAEEILSTFYQITPDKLMPIKERFLTEICNLIGLAHLDKIKFKADYKNVPLQHRLKYIFNVPFIEKKRVKYVLGDINTYTNPAEPDHEAIKTKLKIDTIEDRLKHCRFNLERCHLYHELAKTNVREKKFEEIRKFSRKVIEEANRTNNLLWVFLGLYMICKGDIIQSNLEMVVNTLNEAQKIVKLLKMDSAEEFVRESLKVCFKI